MTEAEWLAASGPMPLVVSLRGKSNRRKLQLFVCATCRSFWHALEETSSHHVLEISERDADGEAEWTEVANASGASSALLRNLPKNAPYYHIRCAAAWSVFARSNQYFAEFALRQLLLQHGGWDTIKHLLGRLGFATIKSERNYHTQLLRDIFGNPFRPVTCSPDWRTDTAVLLAKQMYESREFGAMPILADALQDAGCDNDDILNHCRGDSPHVRGCWVCDLVLGKE
jgi:hypothetical protein